MKKTADEPRGSVWRRTWEEPTTERAVGLEDRPYSKFCERYKGLAFLWDFEAVTPVIIMIFGHGEGGRMSLSLSSPSRTYPSNSQLLPPSLPITLSLFRPVSPTSAHIRPPSSPTTLRALSAPPPQGVGARPCLLYRPPTIREVGRTRPSAFVAAHTAYLFVRVPPSLQEE